MRSRAGWRCGWQHTLRRQPVRLGMDRTAVRWPGRIHRAPLPGDAGLQGGKGVATALGVLAGLAGTLALATLVVWLAVAFISRYSSAAALSAALAAPPLTHWLVGSPAAGAPSSS